MSKQKKSQPIIKLLNVKVLTYRFDKYLRNKLHKSFEIDNLKFKV